MIPIPTHYIGEQEWPGRRPVRLYNMLVDIPGHPYMSTVSLETLEEMGYTPQEAE
jgi:hypothetical protein